MNISNNLFYNKKYSECKYQDPCIYEVLVSLPVRKKRDLSSMRLQNMPFLIGESKTCAGDDSYNCNGALVPGTKYKISLRIYSSNGFKTVGQVEKITGILTVIIASVAVILIVVIVVVIAIIVWKRNQIFSKRRNTNASTTSTLNIIDEVPLPTEPTHSYANSISISMDNIEADTSTNNLSNTDQIQETKVIEENPYEVNYKPMPRFEGNCTKYFGTTYRNLKENNNTNMIALFEKVKSFCKSVEQSGEIEMVEVPLMRNRYRNILPYKHTAIQIDAGDGYINASKVCLVEDHWLSPCHCTKYFIASQGPLDDRMEKEVKTRQSTVGDFWRSIVEHNVGIIVNLTNCFEEKKEKFTEKCAQYWPEKPNTSLQIKSYDDKISVKFLSVKDNSVFDERKLEVSMGEKKKIVTQLHCKIWFDFKAISVESFLELYTRFCQLRHENGSQDNSLIHCSAGVGRTGTFLLIDFIFNKIKSGEDILSVEETLCRLRMCRPLLVQTIAQFEIIHDILLEEFKRKELLDS